MSAAPMPYQFDACAACGHFRRSHLQSYDGGQGLGGCNAWVQIPVDVSAFHVLRPGGAAKYVRMDMPTGYLCPCPKFEEPTNADHGG